ncbi:MAG: Dyp-type peroxidase [Magnetococcales bacterium]|nr:Dyp-type peroxidase [Magnetococcales bacterium]
MTWPFQKGILEEIPSHGRAVELEAIPGGDVVSVLGALKNLPGDGRFVIGLGPGLIRGLNRAVPGLRPFSAMTGPGVTVPATQADLWCWGRGEDPGHVLHDTRAFLARVGAAFRPVRAIDLFKYDRGLDLTGYEDGTENPKDDDARSTAILSGCGPGLDGSSFVAVQQWRSDLTRFESFSRDRQDHIIGRRRDDNEEIGDAPQSAHVKRTAQESFDPTAFVVRRSMPWANESGAGLMFIAFGRSLDPFEAQLRRMTGLEDGITDALFQFTRPLTGSCFWCPPVDKDGLDLSAIGM